MQLYHVRMDVDIPRDLDEAVRADIVAREKKYSQDLQRAGKWRSIWRVVGQYSNISIFAVDSPAELHDILWNLPLFPYMRIEILPLTTHPSSIEA